MKLILRSICAITAMLLLSCSTPNVKSVAPDVMDEFVGLLDSGKLPGIAPKDPIEDTHIRIFQESSKLKYPARATVFAIKKRDETIYDYTFEKEKADGKWELVEAAKKSPDGERTVLK